jgi:hypothetical protein
MPNLPDLPTGMGEGMPGMPTGIGAPGMLMPENMPGPKRGVEGGFPGEAPRRRSSRTLQFSTTGETTNLLGYACTRYELRQRDREMEIWATKQLIPFHPWRQDPPPRHHGPQVLEEGWGAMLQARKLFPLLIIMKNESGERLPFEFKVTSLKRRQFSMENAKLFEPPPDYLELEPPPFRGGPGMLSGGRRTKQTQP